MLYRLRDVKVILGILLLLSWVGGGVGFYVVDMLSDNTIAQKTKQVEHLQQSLDFIGTLVPAFRIRAGVPAGKVVEETDLEQVKVPIGVSQGLVTDLASALGKYYRLPLSVGSLLTTDSIYNIPITDDMRFLDVILHQIPIGLQSGDYVDIRILMPMGQDFLAMSQKRVVEVNAGVLKIKVTEQDIHTYNSMLLDSILYRGTQIYAIEYIHGSAQRPGIVNYPMSAHILAVMRNSPNLLSAIQADILQRRGILETGLAPIGSDGRENINQIIEQGRTVLMHQMSAAHNAALAERSRQLGLTEEFNPNRR